MRRDVEDAEMVCKVDKRVTSAMAVVYMSRPCARKEMDIKDYRCVYTF